MLSQVDLPLFSKLIDVAQKCFAKLILLPKNKKHTLKHCRVLLQICADPFTKAEISRNQPPVLNLHCQHKRWPSTAL